MRFDKRILVSIALPLLLMVGLMPQPALAQGPYGGGYYGGPYRGRYYGGPPYRNGCYGGAYGNGCYRRSYPCSYYGSCFTPIRPRPQVPYNRFYNGGPGSTYIVRPGDTLFSIARRFGVSVGAILAANPYLSNPNFIYSGERLVIPGRQGVAYPPPSAPTSPAPVSGQAQVAIQNSGFQPQQIRVTPGTTVTWTNQDSLIHTVVAGTQGNPSGMFDSGDIQPSGSFSFTFQNPGTYSYYDRIYQGMSGTVTVEPGTGPQTTPQAPTPQPAPGYGGGY